MKNEKKNTEFEHFSSLANDWWSKNGKFKILHDIQPIRIKYILEALNKKNLNNTKILDIGCGGGLVSEGLAKIGATVTGIDFIKENINVAKNEINILAISTSEIKISVLIEEKHTNIAVKSLREAYNL